TLTSTATGAAPRAQRPVIEATGGQAFGDSRPAISAMGRPEDVALITERGSITHDALRRLVDESARDLAGPRRLAVVNAGRDLESVVAYLGAMAAGHPVLLQVGGPRSSEVDQRFAAGLTFSRGEGWESTGASEIELHPDLALLLSTSGTTGSPKLVRLSSENVSSNARAIAQYLDITPDDRALATLPLQYCYGLSVLNSHLMAGAAVVLTEAGVVDPCCWDLAESSGATSFAGVPHTFAMIERRGVDCLPETIRTITQAGGRMGPEAVRRWAQLGEERGFDFVVMYGQTEATARMAWLPPELAAERPGAIGVPIPGGQFRLDGEELVYSGPNVMMGYAHDPADLARGNEITELHTGDLATQATDGLWEITGRAGRFAKPMGLRVDLQRIEEALGDAGVAGACVGITAADDATELVGVLVESAGLPSDEPDPVKSTQGASRSDGLVDQTIDLICSATGLPPAALRVETTQTLPLTESGKVDLESVRAALVKNVAAGAHMHSSPDAADAGASESPTDRVTAVISVFAAALPTRRITPEETFVDLGGDSLSYVEVSMELETLLGSLPTDWHLRTVSELAELEGGSTGRRLARVEIGGVLRTLGILMVVSRHVQLTDLGGGAHVLMALSGFNFSRFPLTASMRDGRYRRLFVATLRVAVPTALWMAAVVLITGGYSWANVGFVNAVFGPDSWGDTWRYWYLEALVQILAVMALLFCIPAVRSAVVKLPFALPLALTAVTLTVRFGILEYGHEYRQVNLATGVAWLFMVGWTAQRAETIPRKLLVSAIALVALPGWFGDTGRELTIAVALLGIIWLREVPLPRFLSPAIGVVGGASMWIYLTHWQVYPPLEASVSPVILLGLSILTGVLAQHAWDWASGRAAELLRRRRTGGSSYADSVRRSTRNEPVAETSSKRPLSSAGK
ncbi:MAG: AMP-binding protein, partial [Microthrixaceae bacterium]